MAHMSVKKMELRADVSSTAAATGYVSNGTQSIASSVYMKPRPNESRQSRMMQKKKKKETSGGTIRDDEKSEEKNSKNWTETGKMSSDQQEGAGKESQWMDQVGEKQKELVNKDSLLLQRYMEKENYSKSSSTVAATTQDGQEIEGGMDAASLDRSKGNQEDLDVIRGGVDRLHMCVDNTVSPISLSPIICNSSAIRMGLSSSNIHKASPVNDYKIWEPIRVIVDGRGRKKITKGEDYGEIYSVRVLDFGGKPYRKIHGLIWLNTALGHTYLFRRNNKNPMTISRDQDMIPLTGPIVATFGYDWGVMIILKEGDDDLCTGIIDDFTRVKFNQTMTRKFKGSSGSAAIQVNCASYSDAILSEVEIKLIENQNTAAKIFGRITVSVDNDKKLTSTIFHKNVDESVTLGPGQVIPLSRPLLSVPRLSYLLLTVDLWEPGDSLNKPLVRGSLRFQPQYFGGDPWTLEGECGKIEVKITWFDFNEHPKSMARLYPELYPNLKVDVNELCPDMEGEVR